MVLRYAQVLVVILLFNTVTVVNYRIKNSITVSNSVDEDCHSGANQILMQLYVCPVRQSSNTFPFSKRQR